MRNTALKPVANRSKTNNVVIMPTKDTTGSGPTLAYSHKQHRESLREASDKELLWALRDGDELALDELIERKTQPLLSMVYRMLNDEEESRDIVQVTFFRLWEHRDRFDERWSPNTWIYRIATNLAIDQLRSRRSKDRQAEPMRLHMCGRADERAQSEGRQMQESEVMRIFQELSEELTDKQKTIFLLREVEGRPSKEVAEVVGCRESTVRNHLFNARKILRQLLVDRYPEYARQYLARQGATS